jgi:hypothetical protein
MISAHCAESIGRDGEQRAEEKRPEARYLSMSNMEWQATGDCQDAAPPPEMSPRV